MFPVDIAAMMNPAKKLDAYIFRCHGNKEYERKNYIEAMILFNRGILKSLSSQGQDDIRALCYGSRSAVYYDLKFYELCLVNVKLAEEHYPQKDKNDIFCLREKCRKMRTMLANNPDDECAMEFVKNQFALTYEPNPKLPFFIDGLDICENEEYGRHLITKRDLKAGDIIAEIKNCWTLATLQESNGVACCPNCLSFNDFDLNPYGDCKEALFCSEKCHDDYFSTISRVHDTIRAVQMYQERSKRDHGVDLIVKIFFVFYEAFGSVTEMKNFTIEQNIQEKKYSIFDFDLSCTDDPDMYAKNMLLVIMSSVRTDELPRPSMMEKGSVREYLTMFVELDSDDYLTRIMIANEHNLDFIDEVFMKIAEATERLFISFIGKRPLHEIGSYFHPSVLMLNHSCDPNVNIHVSSGEPMIWMVNRPLKAGSQIFIAYGHSAFYDDYNGKIPLTACHYPENCIACKNSWRRSFNHQKINAVLKETMERAKEEPKYLTDGVKQCADFINDNFPEDYESNAESRELIAVKMFELRRITNLLSNPLLNFKFLKE